MSLDPKTREEQYLSAIANGSEVSSVAVTREEKFLRGILNGEPPALKPITRKEMFYKAIAEGGTPGGGSSGGSSGGGGDNFPLGDGNTHIWISLAEGRTSPMFGVCVNGTVTVDWGDGSAPDTLTGISISGVPAYTPIHNYPKAGNYVITVKLVSGVYVVRAYSACTILAPSAGKTHAWGDVYASMVKKVELGIGAKLGDYAFHNCYHLEDVILSESVDAIASYSFSNCVSLRTVNVPHSVTTVNSNSFSLCWDVVCYDFSQHTSIPTLQSTAAFPRVTPDCIFKVPASLYDEWIAATNWSALAATNTFVGV